MYVFLIACANGDVLLEQDGTPKILWGDAWSPICGHYFWDNQVGATKFCQKLGYGKGAQSGSGSGNHYTTDSFRLGSCQEGDELTGCTGGCNDYVVGGQCSNSGIFSSDECTQGDANAMTIHCIEPSNTVFNPSCTSKLTTTYTNLWSTWKIGIYLHHLNWFISIYPFNINPLIDSSWLLYGLKKAQIDDRREMGTNWLPRCLAMKNSTHSWVQSTRKSTVAPYKGRSSGTYGDNGVWARRV